LIVVINGAFPTADDDDLAQAEEAVLQGVRDALKVQGGR